MVLGSLTGHLHYGGKGGGGYVWCWEHVTLSLKLTCRLTNNHCTILFSKAARVLVPTVYCSLVGHTLSQEKVWYFTMQRFVGSTPNVYVVCVLCNCVYTCETIIGAGLLVPFLSC